MLSGSLVKGGELFKSGHRLTGDWMFLQSQGAACARVHPSDITYHSFIAGELCPSSSLSPQHIWQTFKRWVLPPGRACSHYRREKFARGSHKFWFDLVHNHPIIFMREKKGDVPYILTISRWYFTTSSESFIFLFLCEYGIVCCFFFYDVCTFNHGCVTFFWQILLVHSFDSGTELNPYAKVSIYLFIYLFTFKMRSFVTSSILLYFLNISTYSSYLMFFSSTFFVVLVAINHIFMFLDGGLWISCCAEQQRNWRKK